MSNPAPFGPVTELLERNLNIRHVYGEPVHHGDKTVIPVARVAYGFGAGGGRKPGSRRDRPPQETPSSDDYRGEAQGGGGGGFVYMTPIGVFEITSSGTRFVRPGRATPWLVAAVVGVVTGWLLGMGTSRSRQAGIEA
jgi:uncharacterized spore protein YtfJ